MNWLAKVVRNEPDEFVHAKLVKYGIGSHHGPRAHLAFSKKRIAFKVDLGFEETFIQGYVDGAPEGTHTYDFLLAQYESKRRWDSMENHNQDIFPQGAQGC
jgi:hypothetical protein